MVKGRISEEWLEIDYMQNAYNSLEMAFDYLGKVHEKIINWKWVIIGIHNALQSYMVLALRGTTPMNILMKNDANRWLTAYEKCEVENKLYLDSYLELFKKIQSERMMMYTNSKKYVPKGNEAKNAEKLNDLRRDFMHFKINGWSIQIGGLPIIILDIINIIEFLTLESGNIQWEDTKLDKKTINLLEKGRSHLISDSGSNMISANVLFTDKGKPLADKEIQLQIAKFKGSYEEATHDIILNSLNLDEVGKVFHHCVERILKNYGMTRAGVFHGINQKVVLNQCWEKIGADLLEIRASINASSHIRDRYLIEISEGEREKLIDKIWGMTKAILPYTMSASSYGLVGASKILFSVLPEIVLPTDNTQWKQVFKTVDLGDVIRFMAEDIMRWEAATGQKLNQVAPSSRLTTLPSIYNVVALEARPE